MSKNVFKNNKYTKTNLFYQFHSNQWMETHEIWNLSCQYTYQQAIKFSWWSVHAGARKRQKRAQLYISIRSHAFDSDVRVHARTIIKIYLLVDRYTESLSFKFNESSFLSCWEIAKNKFLMHT